MGLSSGSSRGEPSRTDLERGWEQLKTGELMLREEENRLRVQQEKMKIEEKELERKTKLLEEKIREIEEERQAVEAERNDPNGADNYQKYLEEARVLAERTKLKEQQLQVEKEELQLKYEGNIKELELKINELSLKSHRLRDRRRSNRSDTSYESGGENSDAEENDRPEEDVVGSTYPNSGYTPSSLRNFRNKFFEDLISYGKQEFKNSNGSIKFQTTDEYGRFLLYYLEVEAEILSYQEQLLRKPPGKVPSVLQNFKAQKAMFERFGRDFSMENLREIYIRLDLMLGSEPNQYTGDQWFIEFASGVFQSKISLANKRRSLQIIEWLIHFAYSARNGDLSKYLYLKKLFPANA